MIKWIVLNFHYCISLTEILYTKKRNESQTSDVDTEDPRTFSLQTVVGGSFESACSDQAACYFAGFIAHKPNQFHTFHFKKTVPNVTCLTIF